MVVRMRRKGIAVTVVLVAAMGWMGTGPALCAQGDAKETVLKVEKRDPALDHIVPKDAKLEELAGGYLWLEGPVWDEGSLFFADVPNNSILRWMPGRGVITFLEQSGYKGKEPYGGPEPGSNGMTLDAHGRLTVAGHAARNVFRFEPLDPNGPITILADSYQGKKLNSPDDVVYRSDGSAYFTDPPYGLRTQDDKDPEKELTVNGVYRIPHALEQKPASEPMRSELQLLISDLPRPNGIAFSPDEKYLYVNNSEPQKIWMRYTVNKDGTLSEPKLLFDATSDLRIGNPDGMKVDVEGNIYSAGPGGVWIFSPDGKPMGTLLIPEKVSNVAWQGADSRMLYITTAGKLYRVRLNIAGAPMIKPTKK